MYIQHTLFELLEKKDADFSYYPLNNYCILVGYCDLFSVILKFGFHHTVYFF